MPPPGGSMSRFALANNPAPTPLPLGSSEPAAAAAAAAQQLLCSPPRPASLACRLRAPHEYTTTTPRSRPPSPLPPGPAAPTNGGRAWGWREAAEARYLLGGSNHSDPRGGGRMAASGRCSFRGFNREQHPLEDGAERRPRSHSAHVAEEPGTSHAPLPQAGYYLKKPPKETSWAENVVLGFSGE